MKSFKPLTGVQILDFTRLIPGPFCSKILSDFGAQIIKIEDLHKGDYIGSFSASFLDTESVLGVYLNKNKKRLKLDFASVGGRQIIQRLVKKADVVMESYRPGVMKKIGLDHKVIHQWNPKIIYASLTGYGQKSKRARQAGHDVNFMAISSMISNFHGEIPRFQMADFVGGGLFAAMMIVSALHQKQKKRITLDLSMVDSLVYLNQHQFFANEPINLDHISGGLARYHIYKAKDGELVALAALEDKFWHRFCDAIKRPKYKDSGLGAAENKRMRAELSKLFLKQDSRYWKKFGFKNDICLTVVSGKKDLIQEEYLKAISLVSHSGNAKVHEAKLLSQGNKQRYKKSGADNRVILKDLGYSTQAITQLKKKGIIY